MAMHFGQMAINYGHLALRPSESRSSDDTSTTATNEDQDCPASAFVNAECVEPDPILGMRDAFLADTAPNSACGITHTKYHAHT